MKTRTTSFVCPWLLGLVFCWVSLLPRLGTAQTSGSLTGTVVDANGEAVSFANVVLLQATTNNLVTGIAAEMNGTFQLPTPAAGTYTLKLSMLGYTTLQTPVFTVTEPGFSRDFGRLVLPTETKLLQEVKVQGVRPTVFKDADKLVVSVASSALASGNTALDVLTKAPGIALDQNGNLQLNGKAGVQVLLDGKRTYLTGKELQNLLQSMSAENILALEISSGASAKYDAAGSAGVINLNLKKNTQTGLSGSVYAGYQYNQLHGYSTGADVSYRRGRWNTSLGVDMARRTRFRTNEMHREFRSETTTSTFDQQDRETGTRNIPALRANTEFTLSPRHAVGASLNFTQRHATDQFLTGTLLRDGSPDNDLLVQANNQVRGNYSNGTINLHYTGRLDSAGTSLTTDFDYARLRSTEASTFRNSYDSLGRDYAPFTALLTSQNSTDYDIYAARLDFSKTLRPGTKLELGAKASHVTSDNEVRFYAADETGARLDSRRSNHFIYQEAIYAAYASLATHFGEKWQVQAGLRAEYTQAKGHSLTLDQTTSRSYWSLFPSLLVQQHVTPDYQLTYSYSRRLDRPSYETLNPFILYLDPYTWLQGNPQLKPQYTNSLEVSQTLKQQYSLTLGYTSTQGFMAEVPTQYAADKTTVFQQQNVKSFRSLSASVLAPVRVTGAWQMSNSATVAYQRFMLPVQGGDFRNQQLMVRAQSTHSVLLPRQLRLELNASYQGPMAYGLYRLQANWGVDAGLKRSFCQDKLDVSVNATDLFKTRRQRATANLGGNINAFNQYAGAQSLRLTLRYRFRRGQPVENRKPTRSLEEVDRTQQ